MLARLSITIQEVARFVSEVEAKIIHDYETSKEKIMQKVKDVICSHCSIDSTRAALKDASSTTSGRRRSLS